MKKDCMAFEEGTEKALAIDANIPALVLEHPTCTTTAEAVRFDLAMAKQHGALTLAYLARAGWRLACEKESVGHGAWMDMCKELGISADTAGVTSSSTIRRWGSICGRRGRRTVWWRT